NMTEKQIITEETLQKKKRGAKRKCDDDDADIKILQNRKRQRTYHEKKKEMINSFKTKINELEEALKNSKKENDLLINENESLKERDAKDNEILSEISPTTNICDLNNKNSKIDVVEVDN
ncbi:2437_t:CDS:2, partial [Scutellospora calospora]